MAVVNVIRESFDKHAFAGQLIALSEFSEFLKEEECCEDNFLSTMKDEEDEELEWITNKDAFPSIETVFDAEHDDEHPFPALQTFLHAEHGHEHAFPALETFLDAKHGDEHPPCMMFEPGSPVSVLENSTLTSVDDNSSDGYEDYVKRTNTINSLYVPVRARSKCCRKRREFGKLSYLKPCEEDLRTNLINVPRSYPGMVKAKIGPKCLHCGSEKTPQWRAGPCGPKTLCNACGVRYKSGRLVPEYRPACSPTFSNKLHSNSHRKIMEMRRVKGCSSAKK